MITRSMLPPVESNQDPISLANAPNAPHEEFVHPCPTNEAEAFPIPVSMNSILPNVHSYSPPIDSFPLSPHLPFIAAPPLNPSLISVGAPSLIPGRCIAQIEYPLTTAVSSSHYNKEILEQELLLEEEELRLKRKRLMLSKMSEQCAPRPRSPVKADTSGPPSVLSLEDCLRRLTLSLGLPKMEIDPFSGCANEFVTFMSNFSHIESQLTEPRQKFSYLLHYCRGPAKEAIKHCALLPDDACFSTAVVILKSEFGRPHQIIQAVCKDLYSGPPIRATDQESLVNLLRQMRSCQLTLRQLNRNADLDCSTNMSQVVRRLPKPMQIKWAEIAESLIAVGREVTFDDLLTLVERRVAIGSTDYGIIAFEQATHQTTQSPRRVAALTTRSSCQLCGETHELESCPAFAKHSISRRWQLLKEHKRCFRCLKGNHSIRDCQSKIVCHVNKCTKHHHPLLHFEGASKQEAIQTCKSYSLQSSGIRLGFIPVRLVGPRGTVDTYAFLDDGSDCTLVHSKLLSKLGLKTEPTSLQVSTLHGVKNLECKRSTVKIESLCGSFSTTADPVIVVDDLPVGYINSANDAHLQWPHLSDIVFQNLPDKSVGILIGCDVPAAHWVTEQRVGSYKHPFATKSPLGWVLRGPTDRHVESLRHVNAISRDQSSIEALLTRLYDSEFLDLGDSEALQPSIEDVEAQAKVESSLRLIDSHYELGVPWRSASHDLPNNYQLALMRLNNLGRKLLKDRTLQDRYVATMRSHIEKGHLRLGTPSVKRWYLPHHPVINPKKPEKLRIVFDCAATCKGSSLNEALLQGPDIVNSLTGVLHRFRRYPVALSADIKEMFLQVRLPDKDKWAFSTLWWKHDQPGSEPEVYEWNVHPFGAKSSPFCANYALMRTFSDNMKFFGQGLEKNLLRHFYVDDFLGSTNTVEQATAIVSNLPKLLAQGGFELVKWSSNREEVLSLVSPESLSTSTKELSFDNSFQRTLGIKWNINKDVFMFDMIEPIRYPSRRSLLAYVASIFDPLGFVAPVLLLGKLILQQACRNQVGWDSTLDGDALLKYHKWLSLLTIIATLEVPRCLIPNISACKHFELHVFSDASESGYGAVGYLCAEWSDGSRHCSFLSGKSRVAPVKFTTIPRLELTAALIASKLSSQLVHELDLRLRRVILWTDSAIVLRYLSNTSSRYATFVANRIRRIQEVSNPSQWRHVPSELNPADVASRGMETKSASKLHLWLDGPEFLLMDESKWPNEPLPIIDNSIIELKIVAAVNSDPTRLQWFRDIVDRSHEWLSLLRKISWLSRFKIYLLIKLRSRTDVTLDVGNIKPDELRRARVDVIRMVNLEHYPKAINHNKELSKLRSLKPVIVDGIICLGGRVQLREKTLLPILPTKDAVTELIIQHVHVSCGHAGASHVLSNIRREYWIVKGMAAVKRVLRSCIECRRLHALPCQQAMAPLPMFRIDGGLHAFSHTGVDYFGPFHVRHGRGEAKRYGCLFTCMQVRAIHIELVHDLTTDSFLMALDRFVCRRGVPSALYSDNGSNFIGAEKELKEICRSLDQNRITNATSNRGFEWYFNPASSSHRGGAWERMIRTVRRILSHLVKEQVVSDEVILTALAEAERVVNDRPIIPVYDDPERPSALCPNDLLLLRPNTGLIDSNIPLRERMTKRWRQACQLADNFWKRWRREYLPTLEMTRKWLKSQRNLRNGDLVLVSRVDCPRGKWPMGVVCSVLPGPDGLVRQVTVKTTEGIIRRDVRSLCLLEGAEE